ncbi:hypothetical protein V8E36_005249 [Tilletia maclaganii]
MARAEELGSRRRGPSTNGSPRTVSESLTATPFGSAPRSGQEHPELQHLGGWESGSARRYIRDIHLRHAEIGANIDVDALRRPLIGADTQDRFDIPQHKDARRRRVNAVLEGKLMPPGARPSPPAGASSSHSNSTHRIWHPPSPYSVQRTNIVATAVYDKHQ